MFNPNCTVIDVLLLLRFCFLRRDAFDYSVANPSHTTSDILESENYLAIKFIQIWVNLIVTFNDESVQSLQIYRAPLPVGNLARRVSINVNQQPVCRLNQFQRIRQFCTNNNVLWQIILLILNAHSITITS